MKKSNLLAVRYAAGGLLIAAVAFWMISAAAPLVAKRKPAPTTKTVRGRVLDGSDNPISGAAVEMTDLTTGDKSAIYTQKDGEFQFAGLRPTHDFQFQATYKGKHSGIRKVGSWDVRMRMVLNLHIPPLEE